MSTTEYPEGTVYVLHLDPPYKHARHYTGYAEPGNLQSRLTAHAAGTGARLMQVITEAGGTFRLARTWPGGRTRERELKNRHDAPRLCPICTEHPKPAQGKDTGHQRPVHTPTIRAPLPEPSRPLPYERGAASARRLIQQQINAGFSADQIANAQARILSVLIPERLRPEGHEEARGYRDTAEAMIAACRQAPTPQPAVTAGETVHPQEGPTMNADSSPGMSWLTKEEIEYTRKVAAQIGRDPQELIREGEQIKADAYRQAHTSAQQTTAAMAGTGRGMYAHPASPAAQADQAHVARAQPQPQAELEAEAG
jgi:hypothetical protein